ncbi:MAG: STAS domain-containing protein [Phycisphaerae bacterium]|nr:STAS domain-containing protein [Phycisphaerae bacterium]
MGIVQWSEQVLVADVADDPMFTDELDALFDTLTAGGDRDVLIDLSAVSFVNSSNIALLLKLRKYQRDHSRKLRLCGIAPAVWSVFTVTGLESLFEVSPQVTTALAEMQAAAAPKR